MSKLVLIMSTYHSSCSISEYEVGLEKRCHVKSLWGLCSWLPFSSWRFLWCFHGWICTKGLWSPAKPSASVCDSESTIVCGRSWWELRQETRTESSSWWSLGPPKISFFRIGFLSCALWESPLFFFNFLALIENYPDELPRSFASIASARNLYCQALLEIFYISKFINVD